MPKQETVTVTDLRIDRYGDGSVRKIRADVKHETGGRNGMGLDYTFHFDMEGSTAVLRRGEPDRDVSAVPLFRFLPAMKAAEDAVADFHAVNAVRRGGDLYNKDIQHERRGPV